MDEAFEIELSESKCSIQDFLKRRNPAWNLVGRVHFNLAENRKDEGAPFAFLATYTTRLSAHAKAQHLPLGAGAARICRSGQQGTPLSLLLPVQRAPRGLPLAESHGRCGQIFHPLRWHAQRGDAAFEGRPAIGERGRGSADASGVAGQPSPRAAE